MANVPAQYSDGWYGGSNGSGEFLIEVAQDATPDKGFLYQARNASSETRTAFIQIEDRVNGKVSWLGPLTLAPGESRAIGHDRPDGPVYVQWYFFSSGIGRPGNTPPYPVPTATNLYGDGLNYLGLYRENGGGLILMNRNSARPIHVSWTYGPAWNGDEWLDPNAFVLAGYGDPSKLNINFSAIGMPSRSAPSGAGAHLNGVVRQFPEGTKSYSHIAIYAWPGPLPCGAVSHGASKPVDAGPELGYGYFVDYVVMCAGISTFIHYNRFQPVTKDTAISQQKTTSLR